MIRIPESARHMLQSIYIRLLQCSGLLWWARKRIARDGVVVLTLHRVLSDDDFDRANCQRGMMVRATTFDRLLAYLREKCECVPLIQPGGAPPRLGAPAARPRVALTFDDGWKDNYDTVLPLAQKHGVPFTVFICPGFVEQREPFWPGAVVALWNAARLSGRLEELRQLWREAVPAGSAGQGSLDDPMLDDLMDDLKNLTAERRNGFIARAKTFSGGNGCAASPAGGEFLTWNQIREMAQMGILFGSHTDTHPILTHIPVPDVMRELQSSRAAVEANLRSCSLLAYPNGDRSETVRALAGQCGYKFAFANSPGVWKAGTNPFSIPRVNVWEGKLARTKARFSSVEFEYAVFWKAWRASLQEH